MNASFEEKSAFGTLLIVLAAYGWYGYVVAGSPAMTYGEVTVLIIAVIVISVIAEIIYHALIASHDRTASDERDRLVGALAGRAEGYALVVGVVATIGYTLFREAPSIETVHMLMFTLALGEIVKRLGQLFYYRRGV